METVYFCLGANKANREECILKALELLNKTEGIKITQRSNMYETEPWGNKEQDFFLNLVCKGEVILGAHDLLKACQEIEKQLGRRREKEVRWGAREIDIDILFYGDKIINQPDLCIPHKLLHQRAFVLKPLEEIAPEFVHPVLHKTIAKLYNELESSEKVVLYGD